VLAELLPLFKNLDSLFYEVTMKILKTWSRQAIQSWIKIYEILLSRINIEEQAKEEAY